MLETSLEDAAWEVLGAFPAVGLVHLYSLGNHGGFSGARLWRVESAAGLLCLRAWAPSMSVERLRFIHSLLRLATEVALPFVPRPLAGSHGTWMAHAGRLWELTTWMPGRADFHAHPTAARLQAACNSLARLHNAWGAVVTSGPCPGVLRRLRRAKEYTDLVRSGWRLPPARVVADPIRPWAERAWLAVGTRIERIASHLAPWSACSRSLQPCLCDVWHDHLLFEGDRLTGLVDYGGVKVDHVAVDLARMLGSLVGDDRDLWRAGLCAYNTVRPLNAEEARLAHVLDETGLVLGAATWLLWLYRDRKEFPEAEQTAQHLAQLVRRLESWGDDGEFPPATI